MRESLARFRSRHEFWLLLFIVALVVVLSLFSPSFFTARNLSDMLTSNAYLAILCSGLVVVLIAGGIDVSFTAIASVAQYVAVSYAKAVGGNWPVVFLIACAVGVLCGMFNAVLIYRFRIRSIIATIATLNVFYGLLITISGGRWISVLPDWFQRGISWFEVTDSDDYTYALNLQILLLVLSFVVTWCLLQRSSIGRQIYAMGGNPEAAQRLGFRVFRLHLLVYGYMGLTAGLASIAQAQLAQTVMPSSLVGKELDVLAAVVLGGASLTGGVGTVLGTILGVALLAIMQNGLLLVGVSSYWLQFFSGLVILIAMSITAIQMRRGQVRRRVAA
ncbi:ABC transporter permease [Labrys wisconsinensis]|uniref:Simple sugar transport system permease protein n=1 Tax=Labrys wisconsinensis TaxID=425677 RepID=A0ABU0JAT3_9HYPH|nr:ABC transporter permease [Labrys wisconsinensis]MDQ0471378.1 simple sugar transport system permease protein [Labrys wisconsinensis]